MVRGLTSCQDRCSEFEAAQAVQQVVKKTGAIVSNGARTGISVSCLNYAHELYKAAHSTSLFKSVSLETAIGFSVLSPFTKVMVAVSTVDTLFEKVRQRDLSLVGVACRKAPGLLTVGALSVPFALAATEVLGYYAAYRIIDLAARTFVAFGYDRYSVRPLVDTCDFFFNLIKFKSDDDEGLQEQTRLLASYRARSGTISKSDDEPTEVETTVATIQQKPDQQKPDKAKKEKEKAEKVEQERVKKEKEKTEKAEKVRLKKEKAEQEKAKKAAEKKEKEELKAKQKVEAIANGTEPATKGFFSWFSSSKTAKSESEKDTAKKSE